jgi:hypothetical protein
MSHPLRLALLAIVALPAALFGQRRATSRAEQDRAGRCGVMDFENRPDTRIYIVVDPTTNRRSMFVGGGVVGRCRGQDIRIVADSAESYGGQSIHYLIGNVHYAEPRATIDAQRVTYFESEERILAENDVRVTMSDGSTMIGPRAEYFRAAPPIRTVQRLIAPERPTFVLIQKDSAGGPPKRTTLNANHVVAEGDSLYFAGGNVTIVRDDVNARGDSAFVDEGTEFARLMRNPMIEGKGDQAFTLRGQVIDMFSRDRQLERVLSKDSAHVVSKDIDLAADTIDLRLREQKLQRAFAWGRDSTRARAPGRDIIADSIDVLMPNQAIREVHAIRNAYAETDTDTTKLKSTQRDWVRGDTLIARFDSAARTPGDTSTSARLRQLVASGNAKSFYQIPSSRGKTERPSINYVTGRIIDVALDSGVVQTVTVTDKSAGVYLEPSSDTTTKVQPANRRNSRQPQRPPARPTTPVRRP